MAQIITLIEYANLKSSDINDIVQYAQNKGIAIPNTPEYILDDSILKQIDPVFHHRMKYGKVGTTTSTPKVLGKIDLSSLNNSSSPKVKAKEDKKTAIIDEETKRLKEFGNNHLDESICGVINKVMPHGAYILSHRQVALISEISGICPRDKRHLSLR